MFATYYKNSSRFLLFVLEAIYACFGLHDLFLCFCIQIWHDNMPYNKIADRKGHQGWMKREGPHFIFPGGGTMFPDGAVQYIEKLKQYIPIAGGTLRTALDMGCGVGIPTPPSYNSYN